MTWICRNDLPELNDSPGREVVNRNAIKPAESKFYCIKKDNGNEHLTIMLLDLGNSSIWKG